MSAPVAVRDAVLDALGPKQALSIVRASARVNLWEGSIRSGKTIASLLAWLLFVRSAPRGGALVVISRTRETAARNVFVPLQDPSLFGLLAHQVTYTPGAPTASILGRTVHVLGSSDAKAEKVIRGLTVAGVYVDEATLMPEAVWTQLLGRMSVPGARLFATTNPDSPRHWLRQRYMLRADELGYRVFHFSLADNAHLDPGYVAQISAEYTGLWYRRFILGEWVQAEGAVFDTWDEARHVVDPAELVVQRLLGVGIDYGDTHETRGYLLALVDGPGGSPRLAVLSEWAPGKGTQPVQSERFRTWLAAQEARWGMECPWVAVDSAAASFRNQLFTDGVNGVRNAHKAVLRGIRVISGLLATDRLVVSSTCTELLGHIPGYVWDPKATERGQDAPVKADDDEVDALRYAVVTTMADWEHLVPLVIEQNQDEESEGEHAA